MKHELTLDISFNDLAGWQYYLDENSFDAAHKDSSTRRKFTAEFGDKGEGDVQIDIKICDGGFDGTPFIDAVMFQDGHDVGCLEVRDTLAGTYEFQSFLKDTYVVVIPDSIAAAEEGQQKYRAIEKWLNNLPADKVVKIYNDMTNTDIVDKDTLIEFLLDKCADDDDKGSIFDKLYQQSLGNIHFDADNNSPQCFTDKFLAVEIIICYLNNTWNTEYVYVPYPEAGEMLQETKDKATTEWEKMNDKRLLDFGTRTYIGVYNINWDEPVDKDGNPLDE